jgi:lysyl-tRNA synthetase class I
MRIGFCIIPIKIKTLVIGSFVLLMHEIEVHINRQLYEDRLYIYGLGNYTPAYNELEAIFMELSLADIYEQWVPQQCICMEMAQLVSIQMSGHTILT